MIMMRNWKMMMVTGALLAVVLSQPTDAQVVCTGGVLNASSQFRRTVDLSSRGPVGTLKLRQNGSDQSLRIDLKNLNPTDLSVFISTNSFFDNTNSPVYFVSLLDRTNEKKNRWSQKLTGRSGAPLELQAIVDLNIACLTDIQSIRSIAIGNPGQTNIVDGVTNLFVDCFMWAPIPQLLAKSAKASFKATIDLTQPVGLAPNPKASGSVKFRYNGNDGRSVLDINAKNLVAGQTYSVWMSDAGTNVSIGNLELDKSGTSGRLLLDTKLGDPLPLQVPSVADLTGRVFIVSDPVGLIDLEGSL